MKSRRKKKTPSNSVYKNSDLIDKIKSKAILPRKNPLLRRKVPEIDRDIILEIIE